MTATTTQAYHAVRSLMYITGFVVWLLLPFSLGIVQNTFQYCEQVVIKSEGSTCLLSTSSTSSWSRIFWSFFLNVVMSNQMMFCWSTQVKGCLAKADTGKNVFLKQTQVKGCFDIANTWKDPWWRSINMTPQTVGDEHWELVWFALSPYSLTNTCMYWFLLHSIVELNLW